MADGCEDCGNGENGGGANGVEVAVSNVLNAIAEFTEAVVLIQAAVAEIDIKRGEAVADLETSFSTAILDIETGKQQALTAIQLERSGALQAIRATLPNIAQLVQNAVNILFGKDKGL